MRIGTLVGAMTLAVVASCGGGYGSNSVTGTGGGGGSAVSVLDNYFSPSATTVTSGTKVTWTWGGVHSHNVTFDDGVASATQSSGTYARTFTTAGTYAYHCTIHGTNMSGSVTVK